MTTRYVNPGESIQAAINASVAGDTVLVKAGTYPGNINLNKSITLEGETGANLLASTPGSGYGVSISASNCTMRGFYIDSFGNAITVPNAGNNGANSINGPSNVTIDGNHTYYSNYHYWIEGKNWKVTNNIFQRVRWWYGTGDADYGRIAGQGHRFAGNYLFGTNLSSTDLAPASGTDYSHCDCMQYQGFNGEVLWDCIIENNYFTDFFQCLFLCDEKPGSIRNLIVRNNVAWGSNWTPPAGSANYGSRPSWGFVFGKGVGGDGLTCVNNTIHNCANGIGIRATWTNSRCTNNIITNCGTVYDPSTANPSAVQIGNIIWNNQGIGQSGFAGSDSLMNPGYANINTPLGADGLPMTSDDGWRPTASGTNGFGSQYSTGGTAPTSPPDPTPTPKPTPEYVTHDEFAAAQTADDARMDAIEARLTALETRMNAQPKTRMALRGYDGRKYYGRVEP